MNTYITCALGWVKKRIFFLLSAMKKRFLDTSTIINLRPRTFPLQLRAQLGEIFVKVSKNLFFRVPSEKNISFFDPPQYVYICMYLTTYISIQELDLNRSVCMEAIYYTYYMWSDIVYWVSDVCITLFGKLYIPCSGYKKWG